MWGIMMKFGTYSYLMRAFSFFGPIGNLIPVFYMVSSFRFYYIFVLIGVVSVLFNIKTQGYVFSKTVALWPIQIYMILSAILVEAYTTGADGVADNAIVRLILLESLFVFVIYIGFQSNKINLEEKVNLILYYLRGYEVSLFCGYIIMILFSYDMLTFDTLKKIEVLPQVGYGMLRFSPGSYANEYGIVSSFSLSILTALAILHKDDAWIKKRISKLEIAIVFILTLIALFLSTTRAAYIAYIISLFYLCIKNNTAFNNAKIFFITIMFFGVLGWIVETYFFDFINIIYIGYDSFFDKDASAYERFIAWKYAEQLFQYHYLFGIGFGKLAAIHNIYLELFFELGLFGSIIMLFTLVYLIYVFFKSKIREKCNFLNVISNIGIMHVLWFGMSNHNLNHHLTWFVVFICFMRLIKYNK